MRYYNYLNEEKSYKEDDIDTLRELLHTKCGRFLNECNGNWLYRGVRNPQHLFGIRKVRQNRKPVDNSKDVHRYFDKVLYEMFGWRARSNSLFCTGSISQTGDYGEPYVIFPIGKYNYLHSDVIFDLYLDLIKLPSHLINILKKYDLDKIINWMDIFDKKFRKNNDITEKDVINIVKDICALYKKNAGIDKAAKSLKEVMMHCNEYIEVDRNYFVQNQRELL